MYAHLNDPEWEPDPYESPWTSLEPLGSRAIETVSRQENALGHAQPD